VYFYKNVPFMKAFIATLLLLSTLSVSFFSCKKDNNNEPTPVNQDTAFSTFIKLTDFVPSGNSVGGMDYDPGTQNIYLYTYKSGAKGYSILQLNTVTKQTLIVFTFNDGIWISSNGSEGQRIRVFGNSLYVLGGANNENIHRLAGSGSNTLTLSAVIKMPAYGGPNTAHWGEAYDVAEADRLYVITMRSKITFGSTGNLSAPGSFALGSSSHGASIVYASSGGNAFLVSKGGDDSRIEVRNPVNGNFLRAVSHTNESRTSLEKDSKERVYHIGADKIFRYSPDLLSKEEFLAKDSRTYNQFTLAENTTGKVTLFINSGSEIKSMKLPL
jgi:hypothetical protein